MGTRRTAATDEANLVATAEAGQVTLQLAHHWTDEDGLVGDAGANYAPGDPVTTTPDLARALAGAGLVLNVDPYASDQLEAMLSDGTTVPAVEGQS